jgi:hypothetical protein
MSDNTLNRALRIMGYDTAPGGDEEGAFDGDVVEALLAHDTEKKAPAARRGGAAPAWQGDKNNIRGIYNRAACWADRVRLMQHWSDPPRQPARRCARHLAAQIGGLACSRFDPRQRSLKFVHAVEVDHSLASHLVGPDLPAGDQLVSLGLSEFAIAATALELDEPAPIVAIIVNHGYCMCFDCLRQNRIKPAERDRHSYGTILARRGPASEALLLW